MRVLIIEDDDLIAKPLADDLRLQNHVVDIARNGMEGLQYAQIGIYDLILLDLMLPKLDGIALCKRLRSDRSKAYILMLTARDTTHDKVIGLDAGADDYLVKPFEIEELAARIRALSRRSQDISPPTLTCGQLQLEPQNHKISYAGKPLSLTTKEFMILEYFLRNPNQIITRPTLLDKVWELDQFVAEETLKVHIKNLRSKLREAGAGQDLIETLYGVGYRLIIEKPSDLS